MSAKIRSSSEGIFSAIASATTTSHRGTGVTVPEVGVESGLSDVPQLCGASGDGPDGFVGTLRVEAVGKLAHDYGRSHRCMAVCHP